MSLFKVLGILDLISAIIMGLSSYFHLPNKALLFLAWYLIPKGSVFALMFKDVASMIDIICGLYALSIILGVSNTIITTISALYLIQKALLSLIRL